MDNGEGPTNLASPMRVLLADDDPDILRLLTRFLEREGVTVVSVQDGLQAVDALGRERFDMVITDYQMPYLTGGELLKALKETPGGGEVPVVVMTAYPSEELADWLLREGAAFFLEKPLDFGQLLALVRFAGG